MNLHASEQMVQGLYELLYRLEAIADIHPELHDTEVRERMANALIEGFIKCTADFELRSSFGMYSNAGNLALFQAFAAFLSRTGEADNLSQTEKARAIQDFCVITSKQGQTLDDFVGRFNYSRVLAS